MEVLCKHGYRINVLELEGSIFFGSADKLSHEIDKIANEEGVSYIILDMKRVKEIDSTGVRILQQTYLLLERQGKSMAISYLEKEDPLWQFLKDMGLFSTMGEQNFFPETDLALEHFEDRLLNEILPKATYSEEALLENLTVLQGLQREEMKTVSRFLILEHFEKGDAVFRQGDKSNALFFITKGSADVTISLPGVRRKKRLATLSPGTIFGEMALLDGKPRSANVEAREYFTCYRLSLENFERLKNEHPNISITIVTNISRIIAKRLRLANDMISELEM
jgi:anti-anti-sigma factor